MRTTISVLSLTLIFCIKCFSQNPFPIMYLSGQNFTSGTQNFINSGNAIDAPPFNPPGTDNISSSANVTYTSGTEVILTDGFSAGPFTGTGSFIAQIGNTSQDIFAEIFYPAFRGTYERYEFGVTLPITPIDFKSEIDGFLANPRWPVPNTNTIDPYDPSQIQVKAVFTSPSGQSYIRYGFFFQDVEPNGNVFNPPLDDPFPFRVRFAPPETGIWNMSIYLYTNNGSILIGQPFQGFFNVKYNTGNPGNLVVGNYEHLKFENGNGFFGIGQNIAFAGSGDQAGDPDYCNQRSYIYDLSQKGGNLIRIQMDPWSNGLEWGTNVVCDYQQSSAMEMDGTLTQCESGNLSGQNVYMMVTLLQDQFFSGQSYTPFYWTASGDYANPYYYLLGELNSSETFFTSSDAITSFENYLYYIEARWGYSPNIAIWEFINETDHLGNYGSGTLYGDLPAYRAEVGEWVATMTTFLKRSDLYPYHLVTTGYTSADAVAPDNSDDYLDVWEKHEYNDDADANKLRYEALPLNYSSPHS